MPYFVHLKDRPLPKLLHPLAFASPLAFTSRADAFARVKAIGGQTTHTISFVASDDEVNAWQDREHRRFQDGPYIEPPWYGGRHYYRLHFAHLSTDKPGMIAYTPDTEHGIADKQIRLTPGRYLERFYADRMTREEIALYVAEIAASEATELTIARSRDDIRKVYRNGPSSCMGGPSSHTNQYWTEHSLEGHMPTDVYAEPSDLGVAYFGPIDKPSQRAVVWPEKKTYWRIYGTGPLETILRRASYTKEIPYGAKILNISVRGGYLVPYIDGVEQAEEWNNRFLRLTDDGNIDCGKTQGYTQGEDDVEMVCCDHCDRECEPDDTTDGLCDACYNDRWTCDGCNEVGYDSNYTTIGDNTYCESCTENRTATCQDEDCSTIWIELNEFSLAERQERERRQLTDLCRDCAAHYVYCDHCEDNYDLRATDICPTCEHAPRCEKTGDLLAIADATPAADPIVAVDAVWFAVSPSCNNDDLKDVFWFFDGVCGWSTSAGENWRLSPAHLDSTLADVSTLFVRVSDPRPPRMPFRFPHGLTTEQIGVSDNEHTAF